MNTHTYTGVVLGFKWCFVYWRKYEWWTMVKETHHGVVHRRRGKRGRSVKFYLKMRDNYLIFLVFFPRPNFSPYTYMYNIFWYMCMMAYGSPPAVPLIHIYLCVKPIFLLHKYTLLMPASWWTSTFIEEEICICARILYFSICIIWFYGVICECFFKIK